MKKVFLIFLMLITCISYSQETYKIEFYNLNYRILKGVKNATTSSRIVINIHYSDGSFKQLYYRNIRNKGDQEVNFGILPIITPLRPVRVSCYVNVNFRTGTDANSTKNITINPLCISDFFSGYYSPRMTNVRFNYKVTPIVNSAWPTATLIGFDDLFKVSVHNDSSGFPIQLYNWQYQTVASGTPISAGWINMPTSTNGQSSFSIKPSSFLNLNDIGKRVYFRIKSCNPLISNNIIYYELTRSAPHFNSAPTTNTSCFDAIDGSVTFNFDRGLEVGEKLGITILNTSQVVVKSTPNIILNANNSYTVNNLPSGNYIAQLLGNGIPGYGGITWNTFTESPTHNTTFTINKPTPVEFSFTKVNVWCNGGSDGEIAITAQGGQNFQTYEYLLQKVGDISANWTPFKNLALPPNKKVTQILTGLSSGTYKLKIRDSNGCIAKKIIKDASGQISLGAEIIETIKITEPVTPVTIAVVYSVEPSSFGFSNGRIRAKITGGTPLADGRYNYTWTHSNGTVWTNFTNIVNSNGWFLTLENAIAGTYKLTVTDANNSNATNTAGCTIINTAFTLNQPPLLKLSITKTNAISCNNTNIFSDPWSDGELTATATGGVQLQPSDNNGLPYYYTWKKEISPGVWKILTTQTTNIATNLDVGNYAVNVKDANGIIIGTYTNNILVSPTDKLYTLNQPDLLQITLSKVDVFCNGGNDGSINTTIIGGTGNYATNWNTGAITKNIDMLKAGTYSITVTDDKGCQAQAAITINEPTVPLGITYTFFSPTFTGATNGWIEATVTGGTPLNSGGYMYIWEDSNGANLNAQVTEIINATNSVIKLNNIGAGVYNLTIKDKNYSTAINPTNCTITKSAFELFEPKPLTAMIQLHTPISCNSVNTYGDPFSDGVLEVIAEGGLQLQPIDNNGLPYYYTWKKETSPGIWTVLATQTTNIAANLDSGNYAVNVKDANGIIIGVYVNNILVNATDVTYLLEEPPILELSVEKQDVYCFNGNDGWARVIIKGGVPPYTVLWSNGNTTIQTSNLSQGNYTVSITDSRGCQGNSNIKINQPNTPISIDYTAFSTPSTAGASDGWIEAQITGGTNSISGNYTYYWQDNTGTLLNSQTTTSIINGVFKVQLNNVSKGNYYLTVEDINFALATTKTGCTTVDDEFILYDPIEAIVSVETPISCHQDNVFNDPYSDGALQVVVTGGLPFDTGQPYIYYWKKENTSSGFDDLAQNTPIAIGLSDGNYALNVEDSRGIVIGVYESLNLINATDVLFDFIEPDLLEVSLTATEISCGSGNDGTATVSITGGIAPYNIQWSNGQSTSTATGLIAKNHVVYVTDARGCLASGNITINQPGGLNIEIITQINPTCFQGNDGSISLNITGGILPYTYSWNTGITTTNINNLSEGTYLFKLIDANGCTSFKEITLKQPDEITIDLGADRTLCIEQTQNLNGSISDVDATYVWTSDNGFTATTAQITASEAGTYQVTATSSLGCTATDEIVILVSETEIDTEFLVSSQAYIDEDVILLNVSNPLGETSQWIIPADVTIVNETQTSITLHFPEVTTYEIGLISTQGDCYQELYKNIVVEQSSGLPSAGDAETPFIEEFTITPNPSNGQFEVHIQLAESSPIALRIFSDLGSFVFSQPTLSTTDEYTIPINLSLAAGTYLVVLETAQETQIKRLITF